MWINANERKPDNARKVFVRGIDQQDNVDRVAIACWWDFDDGWRNFIIIDNEYHTPSFKEITHWMEITDVLSLPVEKKDDTEELKQALYTATRLLINIKATMLLRGIRPFANASDISIRGSIDKSLELLNDYILEKENND